MSNVLIGIIGVILFIGLALAGALFLGPRFQESVNNSKAAAAVQAVSQMAHATNLYEVNAGRPLPSGLDNATTLVSSGYLRTMPVNPIVSTNRPFVIDVDGGTNVSKRSGWVLMSLGQTTASRDACIAIERQMGNTTRLDSTVMETVIPFFDRVSSTPQGKWVSSGCHRNPSGFDGALVEAEYIVYVRV